MSTKIVMLSSDLGRRGRVCEICPHSEKDHCLGSRIKVAPLLVRHANGILMVLQITVAIAKETRTV